MDSKNEDKINFVLCFNYQLVYRVPKIIYTTKNTEDQTTLFGLEFGLFIVD